MLESLIAMILICVIFFGAMQISQMFAHKEILYHAAARGARAKTVGFNYWMVRKAIWVSAIPNSGKMITPDYDEAEAHAALRSAITRSQGADGILIAPWTNILSGKIRSSSTLHNLEEALIPEFMATANHERGKHILNYEGWENDLIHYNCASFAIDDTGSVMPNIFAEVNVWQIYTNWLPLHKTYYSGDSLTLTAVSTIENHYPLYLNDQLW